jgi:hypothetical protein
MIMKTESIMAGPVQAFYSIPFYRRVAREWDGEAFVYLFWVLLLIGGLLAGAFGYKLMKLGQPMLDDVIRQIPTIHISQGRAVVDGPQPLTLKLHFPGHEYPIAVVDTHDHYKSIEETGAPMWLNSHELVISNKGEKRIRSLAQIKNATIDGLWLRQKSVWALKICLALCLPIFFIFAYAYRLLSALVYALVGLACNAFFGAQLSFGALWRVSMVAMTPSILLSTLHLTLFHNVPISGYIWVGLTLAYLGFGVWANIPDQQTVLENS